MTMNTRSVKIFAGTAAGFFEGFKAFVELDLGRAERGLIAAGLDAEVVIRSLGLAGGRGRIQGWDRAGGVWRASDRVRREKIAAAPSKKIGKPK